MSDQSLYDQQEIGRQEHSDSIIQSNARNKIIVAGPGTGKSFTFKEFLKTKKGDNLAITFINNLANDLQRDLEQLAESYTFHGYCKKILHRISVEGIGTDFQYYPKLSLLIDSDSVLIGVNFKRIDESFHNLAEPEKIAFYLERGNYYNAVSHSDAVYRVLKHFQSNPQSLPVYCQIVVDEYQDFNPLEVAFIDELIKASPVLIAGDDDQAIYDFKSASPQHVREKANSYEKFELPYCSRCTQVIVDAVHDITGKAKTLNYLQNRIDKKYFCFLPEKEADSIKFPRIIHANCSTHTSKAPYISKYIEEEISFIPQEDIDKAKEKGFPCVLILGPSYYTKQIYYYLNKKFSNIDYPKSMDKNIDILDGYKFLMKNEQSNLGWRILLECTNIPQKEKIIRETHEGEEKLCNKLEEEFKNIHLAVVAILEKIRKGENLTTIEKDSIVNSCGYTIEEIQKILETEDDIIAENIAEEAFISIKIATINGSKGLSANYVFIVGMNNTNSVVANGSRKTLAGFPFDKNNPSDNEICQLIVGITRTRKKCYLVSNTRFGGVYGIQKSVFLDWIDPSRVENVIVNVDYFKR